MCERKVSLEEKNGLCVEETSVHIRFAGDASAISELRFDSMSEILFRVFITFNGRVDNVIWLVPVTDVRHL